MSETGFGTNLTYGVANGAFTGVIGGYSIAVIQDLTSQAVSFYNNTRLVAFAQISNPTFMSSLAVAESCALFCIIDSVANAILEGLCKTKANARALWLVVPRFAFTIVSTSLLLTKLALTSSVMGGVHFIAISILLRVVISKCIVSSNHVSHAGPHVPFKRRNTDIHSNAPPTTLGGILGLGLMNGVLMGATGYYGSKVVKHLVLKAVDIYNTTKLGTFTELAYPDLMSTATVAGCCFLFGIIDSIANAIIKNVFKEDSNALCIVLPRYACTIGFTSLLLSKLAITSSVLAGVHMLALTVLVHGAISTGFTLADYLSHRMPTASGYRAGVATTT